MPNDDRAGPWLVEFDAGREVLLVTATLDFVALTSGAEDIRLAVTERRAFFSDSGGDQVPDLVAWCARRIAGFFGGTARPAKLPPPPPRRRGKA